MASKFLCPQAFRSTRNYVNVAAKSAPSTESNARDSIKTTTLSNGLVVTSVESNAPLSRVAIAYKAGSRNEPAGKEGLVHVLRMASMLSNKNTSQFALTRTLNQAGASLTCSSGREHIAYSLTSTRQHIGNLLSQLRDVATNPAFKPWELSDNIYRVKLDVASIQPQAQVIDLLHKVSFRNGLGNSMFCPLHMIGKHSSDDLKQFSSNYFNSKHAAVVGVGVSHDQLVEYAQGLTVAANSLASPSPSKVHSGDVRMDTGGNMAFVAFATAGSSLTDSKNLLVYAILQRTLGTGVPMKYSSTAGSRLLAVDPSLVSLSALNLSYSDAGLFGMTVAAPSNIIKEAVHDSAKLFRSLKLNSSQLARAKAQLKADLLMARDNTAALVEDATLAALFNKSNNEAVLRQIDQLSLDDLKAAVGALATAKFAVASVGNVGSVPYADEL